MLTLTDQADLVLDLIEGIAERPLAEDSDVGDPGGGFTIHGEVKGEFVSLLGCWVQLYAERRWGSADAVVTQIRALRAVLGVHIADEDEAAFSAVTLNASGLTQWSLPAIRRTPGSSDGLRETLVLGDAELRGGRLRLIHSESRRFSNTGFGRESASTAASLLTFRTGEPLSLRDLLDVPFAVECMLAFAMQRTLPESVLDLEPSKNWPGASSLSEWQSVVILDGWHQVKTADVRFAHQMLFSAYDGDPIELIQRWFEVWDRWGSALKLYLSLLRGSGEFLESRVLSAIRAAEAAAETVGCNRARVSPSEHETLRDAVTNAVPIQHREWIRSTFPRNEHGLRQRLAALVVRLDPQAQAALVPDARKWSKEAAEVRGRLAHEGSDEKREPQHLVAVGEVTGAVVALTVMNELQLDALCLRRAVQGDGPLVRTASLGQRFYRS